MKDHKGNVGRILDYLQNNESITSMQSFELFGATRLSAIIFNLRKDGYTIESVNKKSQNRYGDTVRYVAYKLIKEK